VIGQIVLSLFIADVILLALAIIIWRALKIK